MFDSLVVVVANNADSIPFYFFIFVNRIFVMLVLFLAVLLSSTALVNAQAGNETEPLERPNVEICEKFFDIVKTQFVEPSSRDDPDSCFQFGANNKGNRTYYILRNDSFVSMLLDFFSDLNFFSNCHHWNRVDKTPLCGQCCNLFISVHFIIEKISNCFNIL
jgi:hypothetical protein